MATAAKLSPVTGILEEENVIIDFGDYEGRTVFDISETDPNFYNKLVNAKEAGNFSIRRNMDKTFRLYVQNLPAFYS